MLLREGMFIADRYEILSKIGTGGMSDVYKAKDHVLGRSVAIKVLKKEFSEDVNFVTKFRTEAQSAAGLQHPNIVNIYDVGSENGMYFIVMECIEGITLKNYIEKKGQLSYKEAVSIAIQVGRGIEAAHNKHIVHRDIKPQNIIISTEGKVKVTDFGIARAASVNTIHSDVMGSVHYTSPEQARNGFVDGKSDIYSLGIVMYEMVTGRVPFDGDSTVSVAIQHLQDEMTPPSAYAPNLPISLEKIIQKCTMKNPDRRYDSVSDLLVDLKKVLISPDEDFVTIIPVDQDKTKVIPQEEVETIKKETNRVYYKEDDMDEDEDEEEEEEETGLLNPKMEKAVTIMGIVAAVIIVMIIIFIVLNISGFFRFGGNKGNEGDTPTDITQDDEPITMISVTGMTFDQAKEALKKLGLGIREAGTEASDKYKKGEIIRQSIAKGEEVEKNTTIEVTVCSGTGEFSAPSVLNESDEKAVSIIESEGLVAKRDYVYSDTVPEGKVASQSPEAGASVKKGDTVTYYISRGPETIKVPDVKNKSEEDARAELEEAGFVVKEVTTEYHSTIAEGNVISQSPEAGEYVAKGESISLVVSSGKKTVYYSYFDDVRLLSGRKVSRIELYKAESDELITTKYKDNGESITINVKNIADCDRGVLAIYYKAIDPLTGEVTDNEDPEPDERYVKFDPQ